MGAFFKKLNSYQDSIKKKMFFGVYLRHLGLFKQKGFLNFLSNEKRERIAE